MGLRLREVTDHIFELRFREQQVRLVEHAFHVGLVVNVCKLLAVSWHLFETVWGGLCLEGAVLALRRHQFELVERLLELTESLLQEAGVGLLLLLGFKAVIAGLVDWFEFIVLSEATELIVHSYSKMKSFYFLGGSLRWILISDWNYILVYCGMSIVIVRRGKQLGWEGKELLLFY